MGLPYPNRFTQTEKKNKKKQCKKRQLELIYTTTATTVRKFCSGSGWYVYQTLMSVRFGTNLQTTLWTKDNKRISLSHDFNYTNVPSQRCIATPVMSRSNVFYNTNQHVILIIFSFLPKKRLYIRVLSKTHST